MVLLWCLSSQINFLPTIIIVKCFTSIFEHVDVRKPMGTISGILHIHFNCRALTHWKSIAGQNVRHRITWLSFYKMMLPDMQFVNENQNEWMLSVCVISVKHNLINYLKADCTTSKTIWNTWNIYATQMFLDYHK